MAFSIAKVHDVLGFADPNCRCTSHHQPSPAIADLLRTAMGRLKSPDFRYLVDHWASRGFEALMPDCFEKEACATLFRQSLCRMP